MKIRVGFNWKIKNSDTPLPHKMYGIMDDRGLLELESMSNDNKESYILLFTTINNAQKHIDTMNEDFCIHPNGEKVFWYKNRNNKPVEINTKLIRFKSRYQTIQQAISIFYQQ